MRKKTHMMKKKKQNRMIKVSSMPYAPSLKICNISDYLKFTKYRFSSSTKTKKAKSKKEPAK